SLLAGTFFSSVLIALLIFCQAVAGGESSAFSTFFPIRLSALISSMFTESFSHTAAGGVTSISYSLFCNPEFILLSVFYLSHLRSLSPYPAVSFSPSLIATYLFLHLFLKYHRSLYAYNLRL